MRKLFLISALVLLSATAQAGQTRSLMLASNDTPATAEKIDSIKPDEPKAEVRTETPAAQPATEAAKPVAEPAKPATEPVKKASKPASKSRNYASDEARARSIAARYGISW